MSFSQNELSHVVFLSEVVLEGKKKSLMEDTARCLLYIVKSLPDAELSEEVTIEIRRYIDLIEQQLRHENDRLQEIRGNLHYPSQRKPLG